MAKAFLEVNDDKLDAEWARFLASSGQPKRGGGLRPDRPRGVHLSPGSSDRAGRGEDVTAFLRSLPTAASPVLLLVSYHEDLVGLGRLEPHWVYDTSMMSCRSARWRRVANTKQAAHVAAARSTSTDNVAREDIIDASLAALCEQLEIRSSRTNHLAQTASHLQTSSPLEK